MMNRTRVAYLIHQLDYLIYDDGKMDTNPTGTGISTTGISTTGISTLYGPFVFSDFLCINGLQGQGHRMLHMTQH
jgi:hypothetical protein